MIKNIFLPRYRLRHREAEGGRRYDITLGSPSGTSVLEIGLEAYRPDGTGDEAASLLPHDLILFLVSQRKVHRFTELVSGDTGIRARLEIDGLYDYQEIQQIIASPSQNGRLIARRVVEVEMQANTEALSLTPEVAEERTQMRHFLEEHSAELLTKITELSQTTFNSDEYVRLQLLLRANRRAIARIDAELLFYKWPYVLDTVVAPHPFVFPIQQYPYIYSRPL